MVKSERKMKENERFLSWNERILIGNGCRGCFGKGGDSPLFVGVSKMVGGVRGGVGLRGWSSGCGGR